MTPESPNPALASIQRTLRWLVIATVALYLLLFAAAGFTYLESRTAHNALCTFRANLETQADASKDFLIRHPNGVPGISSKVIQEGIERQEIAIGALSGLSC